MCVHQPLSNPSRAAVRESGLSVLVPFLGEITAFSVYVLLALFCGLRSVFNFHSVALLFMLLVEGDLSAKMCACYSVEDIFSDCVFEGCL